MKYPWAVVGAKVVCVDAVSRPAPGCGDFWNPLVAGQVYCISGIIDDPRPQATGIAICLDGHPNPNRATGADNGYRPDRFAPVRHVNTDATVAALRQATIDAVNNASGGLGIGRKVTA